MALIYRETKREKNSKIKGAVFLEKEQPECIPNGLFSSQKIRLQKERQMLKNKTRERSGQLLGSMCPIFIHKGAL